MVNIPYRPATTLNRSQSVGTLSDTDRIVILNKYDPRTVSICAKCHDVFLPLWRSVRTELKRAQIIQKNGCILLNPFLAILQHFGLKLSSTESGVLIRSFREPGSNVEVIRYDDFLRVCLVAKAIAQ